MHLFDKLTLEETTGAITNRQPETRATLHTKHRTNE